MRFPEFDHSTYAQHVATHIGSAVLLGIGAGVGVMGLSQAMTGYELGKHSDGSIASEHVITDVNAVAQKNIVVGELLIVLGGSIALARPQEPHLRIVK